MTFGLQCDEQTSDAILDRVVNIVKETPSIKHIEIRGFTSSEGIAAKNKRIISLFYSSANALTPVVTTTTYCLPFGAM